jgi:hypothetical protein
MDQWTKGLLDQCLQSFCPLVHWSIDMEAEVPSTQRLDVGGTMPLTRM